MAARKRTGKRTGGPGRGPGGSRQNKSNRAIRRKHPKHQPSRVSVSRQVKASPLRAFDALSRPADLSKWFTRGARARLAVGGTYANRDGDRGTILEYTRPRKIRMTWENPRHCPGTVVTFTVVRLAPGRARARVTHTGLATVKDSEKMKTAWNWALDSYRAYVETGTPITVEAWQRERSAKAKRSASRARREGTTTTAATKRKAIRRR